MPLHNRVQAVDPDIFPDHLVFQNRAAGPLGRMEAVLEAHVQESKRIFSREMARTTAIELLHHQSTSQSAKSGCGCARPRGSEPAAEKRRKQWAFCEHSMYTTAKSAIAGRWI